MATPGYYTTLKPFRELCRTGTPILMYHKLGPLPRGVRIKGLYVREKLFAEQLAELHAAGFTSALPDELFPKSGEAPRVVITFDDGFTNVLAYGLEPLARCRFRAIQFLVADRLGKVNDWDAPKGEVMAPLMDVGQVREWLAAGHAIGAHTLTHPRLAQIPLAAAREEIFSSKKKLEDLFGVAIEHFCFPYGDCNEAVNGLVAEAGFRTACTTVAGVNLPGVAPLALKRLMARHQSLSFKSAWARLTGRA